MTNAAATPKLERTTFVTSRELGYCSEKELTAQTGHSRDECPQAGNQRALETFVYTLVRDRDHVSFIEIVRFAKKAGFLVDGDMSITMEHDLNVVLWRGLSRDLVKAVVRLVKTEKILPEPCDWFMYFADGGWLTLPVARRPPAGGYKWPHWLPVVFRARPCDSQAQGPTTRRHSAKKTKAQGPR